MHLHMHTDSHTNTHRRPGPAGLEDGTLPFTSIAAARHGFDFLRRLDPFSEHTQVGLSTDS